MSLPQSRELTVSSLGARSFPAPGAKTSRLFVDEEERVLLAYTTRQLPAIGGEPPAGFEKAGPRFKLFFDPERLACGIVTCGGLCPGINDVIRSIVMTLTYHYGVERIFGFRYGFEGLSSHPSAPPLELVPEQLKHIHEHGGTLLGSSRGPQDVGEMVDTLVRMKIGILFVIGGDGTLKGGAAISGEIGRRGLPIAVVGIPKTIDNDLRWVTRSFGFTTAVEEARRAISAAHTEALGANNGIGLVKLMGRHSGFIAAHACLASGDANFCLLPEVPFQLEGEGGLLQALEHRLRLKRHAVIVVAEGAGQELIRQESGEERDASGNIRLKDIGPFLKERILGHFREKNLEATLKYIDPSYIIRSLPANAEDSAFCLVLGQHAVHAGMAGKTALMVGHWNSHFTLVPLDLVTKERRRIDPDGELWQRVLEATGQRSYFRGEGG